MARAKSERCKVPSCRRRVMRNGRCSAHQGWMPPPSRARGNPKAWERYTPSLLAQPRARDLEKEATRWAFQEKRLRSMLIERGRDPVYMEWFVAREREFYGWSWDRVHEAP